MSQCKNKNYFSEIETFFKNNYNQYVQYYMNTFQHGGISMEEILIPFITLRSK